jgi:hypothetical protein
MIGMTHGRVNLESTVLATASYDESRSNLELEFRDGARYEYSAVPSDLFRDLLHASSHGSFFNHHIRGRAGRLHGIRVNNSGAHH